MKKHTLTEGYSKGYLQGPKLMPRLHLANWPKGSITIAKNGEKMGVIPVPLLLLPVSIA